MEICSTCAAGSFSRNVNCVVSGSYGPRISNTCRSTFLRKLFSKNTICIVVADKIAGTAREEVVCSWAFEPPSSNSQCIVLDFDGVKIL